MKISPESFIIDDKLCLKYKSFFVTGNDEGYIISLVDLLVKGFCNNGFIKKNLNEKSSYSAELFGIEKPYLYVCNKYLGNELVEDTEKSKNSLIFYEKNSVKNKTAKDFFLKSKESALVECYELDLDRKKIILSGFIKKHGITLENNAYWFLLDSLDNRFSILKQQLEKVVLLGNKNGPLEIANALGAKKSTEVNKFFFKISLSRQEITGFLNSSINSLSDFYSSFSYFKNYSLLLINSKNKQELESKIPKYLFKEKGILISQYSSLNKRKKELLSSLIYKTENLVRKNPSLYKALFFRFLLNYKRIIS